MNQHTWSLYYVLRLHCIIQFNQLNGPCSWGIDTWIISRKSGIINLYVSDSNNINNFSVLLLNQRNTLMLAMTDYTNPMLIIWQNYDTVQELWNFYAKEERPCL